MQTQKKKNWEVNIRKNVQMKLWRCSISWVELRVYRKRENGQLIIAYCTVPLNNSIEKHSILRSKLCNSRADIGRLIKMKFWQSAFELNNFNSFKTKKKSERGLLSSRKWTIFLDILFSSVFLCEPVQECFLFNWKASMIFIGYLSEIYDKKRSRRMNKKSVGQRQIDIWFGCILILCLCVETISNWNSIEKWFWMGRFRTKSKSNRRKSYDVSCNLFCWRIRRKEISHIFFCW